MRPVGAALVSILLVLEPGVSCAPGGPAPQGLTTRLEPALLQAAAAWDWQNRATSVSWLPNGQLYVEERVTGRPTSAGKQLWIDFSRAGAPRVAVREWTAERETRWYFRGIDGRAWVSSDGRDLGVEGGPGLALEYELVGDHAGSPSPRSGRFLLSGELLLRAGTR